MHVWILIIMLFASRVDASFDRFYEYRAFSDLELEVFNYYEKIDSEYFSDVLVFSTKMEDEIKYQLADRVILASFGSLSRSEFLKDNRVKIRHSFSDTLSFQFQYLEQKDYDTLQSHAIFEFGYRPIRNWAFSVFAEMGFEKAEDNLGVSTTYFFTDHHQLRLFFNLVQYDRNKRNTKEDTFAKDPRAFGFVGRNTKERFRQTEYFEYGMTIETPTEWHLPDDDLIFNYKRWMGTLRYLRPINDFDSVFVILQADKRSEHRGVLSTGLLGDEFIVGRQQLQIEYGTKRAKNFDWEIGAYGIKRQMEVWSSRVNALDILPYTNFHFNRNELASGYWSVGYDIDFYDKKVLHTTSSRRTEAEHRLNIYWTGNLSDTAYLRFAFTADTDDFSWEGGNGKFMMEF